MKAHHLIAPVILLAFGCNEPAEETKTESYEKMHVFSSAEADVDFKAGNYRFISYGLEVPPRYNRDSLDKAFGIRWDNQGCEVEDSSIIGANAYNWRMEYLLQQKLGRNWKTEYDWKCDSLQHDFYLKHRNDSNYYAQ